MATCKDLTNTQSPTNEEILYSRSSEMHETDAPECLLSTNADKKFVINTALLDFIHRIPEKLHVICIAGLYRTGKSYLMNRLADVTKGFPLGACIQSKTKGIWVWLIKHPKLSSDRILLMDTEGLGDVKKGDANHDAQLMTLATLLSSTLIYNVKGAFDQDTLDKMTFVTEMSTRMKMKRSGQDDDGDLDCVCPNLIITVRDFCLELEIDGKPLTEDEYLEDCLAVPIEKTNDDKFKRPRLCIRKYFKNRHLVTLEAPGDKRTLQQLETLSDPQLNPEFVKGVDRFLKLVFSVSKPMSLKSGFPLTGAAFSVMVRNYVDAINSGSIPCVESVTDCVIATENERADAEAFDIYKAGMQRETPYEDTVALQQTHNKAFEDANKVFMDIAVYDKDGIYLNKFNEKVRQEIDLIDAKDKAKSMKASKELLKDLYSEIDNNISHGQYNAPGGHSKYEADVNKVKSQYANTKCLGRQKHLALGDFFKEKQSHEQMIRDLDSTLDAQQKELILQRKINDQMRQEKEDADIKLKEAEMAKRTEEYSVEIQKKYLSEKYLKDSEMEQRKHKELLGMRVKEEERCLKEGHTEEMKKLRSERERTDQELASNRRYAKAVAAIKCIKKQTEDTERQTRIAMNSTDKIKDDRKKMETNLLKLKQDYQQKLRDGVRERKNVMEKRLEEQKKLIREGHIYEEMKLQAEIRSLRLQIARDSDTDVAGHVVDLVLDVGKLALTGLARFSGALK